MGTAGGLACGAAERTCRPLPQTGSRATTLNARVTAGFPWTRPRLPLTHPRRLGFLWLPEQAHVPSQLRGPRAQPGCPQGLAPREALRRFLPPLPAAGGAREPARAPRPLPW